MVKALISTLAALALLISGAAFEQYHINKDFKTFCHMVEQLHEKIENETCEEGDVESVQRWWEKKMSVLFTYVPHNDIKDIEIYLVKTKSFVSGKNYEFAKVNTDIMLELCKVIPDIYGIKLHNIL